MAEVGPDLSVIVVSYNTKDVTRSCLRSVVDNTTGILFELILIDNASDDGTSEVVLNEFRNCNIINNPTNIGVAAATNQGINVSHGRFILTMNSDVLVPCNTFKRLVEFMDDHPDAGGATPRLVLQSQGQHPKFIGNQPTFLSEMLFALCLLHRKFADWSNTLIFRGWEDYDSTKVVPCVHWGTCFIVRREVIGTVGMQDPRYFVYCEDLDWSIRIREKGWLLYYVADVTVTHLLNQSTKRGGNKMYAQMWKSRCRMIDKNQGVFANLIFRTLVATACTVRCWLLLCACLYSARIRSEIKQHLQLLLSVFKAVVSS